MTGLFKRRSVILDRYDAHYFTLWRALDAEIDLAVDLGEQRVVLAHANILTGMNSRAALTNDDTSSRNQFAAKSFYPQAFGIRITTVSGTAACFLMCHGKLS